MSKANRKFSLYPIAYAVLTLAILLLSGLILQRLSILPLLPFQVPPPLPKVTLNYNNPEYKFSLKYPQYWQDDAELGALITFVCPMYEHPDKRFHSTNIAITVTEIPADHPELNLAEFALEGEKRLAENAKDYKRVSLEHKTVSGLPAAFITWTWTVEVPVLKETPTPSPESLTPGATATPTPDSTPLPSTTPSPTPSSSSETPAPSGETPTPTPEYEIKADAMISREAIFIKDKTIFIIGYNSLREVDKTYKDAFDLVTSTFKFQD